MTSSYFILLALFLLLPLLLLLNSKFTSLKNKYKLPPGPWTLPVIGSLHHFVGLGLAHRALSSLSQRYGRHLMFLQLGEIQTVVVSSKEAAREVLKTYDLNFCTRPINPTIDHLSGGNGIAFAPYGEYWREIRKICALELLSSKRVQSFRSIREEEVKSMMQQIRSLSSSTGQQTLDLVDKLCIMTNDITLRAIMGRKTKNQDLYITEINNCMELASNFSITNLFPSYGFARTITGAARQAEQALCNVTMIFEDILKEQRENHEVINGDTNHLLGVLLRLHDEASSENTALSIESIKHIIINVLTGGTEPPATTLNWAMSELMKNPRVMKKAQTELRKQLQGHDSITESDLSELHWVQLIIKETMRLHPPAPLLLPRECMETCKILGYDIPKGTMLIVNAWALGRDSNYWKDADKFNPERFAKENIDVTYNGGDFELIPFGAGRRICPGIAFGSALLELALANLLYHFDWELPHGITPDTLDMTESFGITAARKNPLYLRAIPYKC